MDICEGGNAEGKFLPLFIYSLKWAKIAQRVSYAFLIERVETSETA